MKMKTEAKRKIIKDDNEFIIGIGYCKAQHLLKFQEPFAYSTRPEGWACDYYKIDNILVSTGYDFVETKNAYFEPAILKEYDDKAQNIVSDGELTWDEREKLVNSLLKKFVRNAINTN